MMIYIEVIVGSILKEDYRKHKTLNNCMCYRIYTLLCKFKAADIGVSIDEISSFPCMVDY
jgi:hypothetical protein